MNMRQLLLLSTFLVMWWARVSSNRNYSTSFTLSEPIASNVWIQWNIDPSYDTVTGWYYAGSLSAGSHSFTFESSDIGSAAYRVYLGMYGNGGSISTVISSLTSMGGINSNYQYEGTFTLSCTTSTNNCCVIALNTYYDMNFYDETSYGCNDHENFESNRKMNPTVEPTIMPSTSTESMFCVVICRCWTDVLCYIQMNLFVITPNENNKKKNKLIKIVLNYNNNTQQQNQAKMNTRLKKHNNLQAFQQTFQQTCQQAW